jgi:hypothetical protein
VIQTNREDSMEIVSALSTNLSNWLNKLVRKLLVCKNTVMGTSKHVQG